MKKIFKQLAVIAFAAVIGFALTGCGELDGDPFDKGDALKKPLATPTSVRVVASDTALTLNWDAVEGADSYMLDIDGLLTQVSGSKTDYNLTALTADPKVYPIRVRAVAWNGDIAHSDSMYSAPISFEPAEYIFEFEDAPAPSPKIQAGRSIAPTSASGSGTITGLTDFGKTLERVVVPPTIGSVPVTAIGNNAFAGNPQITTISLPETIITIGASAFSGTNITSIVIPDSVLTIEDGAFSNIIVLVVVVFVSVEPPALGEGVFDGSDSIESIVVPDDGDSGNNAYTTMIAEKAPELADTIEVVQEEAKLLVAIEAVQPPKTAYIVGDFFNSTGMTVIARYSDNTTSLITDYAIHLANGSGGFSAQSRPLALNDTAVRLSYTEGSTTRTTNITIWVTELPIYPVTFNAGQGGWTGINGNAITVQVQKGSFVEESRVPPPIRQGFNFAGWVSLSTVNTPTGTTTTETPFSFTTPINSEMNLSAKWTNIPTYTVTFNAGLGFFGTTGNSTMTVQVPAGGLVNSSQIPAPTRQGHTFDGWVSYQTSGTAGTGAEVPFNFNTPINSNITLSAKWISGGTGPTIYIVTFDAREGSWGGTTGNTRTVQVQAGQTIRISDIPQNPTRPGYTFDGWVTNQTSGTGGTEVPFSFQTPINNNMTLYAKWASGGTGQSYNIAINSGNGGTITINYSTMSALADSTVMITVNPNSGYTFNESSLLVMNNATNTAINWHKTAGTLNGYYFIMPAAAVTISGTFSTSGTGGNFIVTVNNRSGGTITLSPNVTGNSYAVGSTVTINVNPDQGYQLQSISVMSGTNNINYHPNASNGFTFSMPAGNVTITPVFIQGGTGQSYSIINTGSSGGGTITTNPSSSAVAGTTVHIHVNPNSDYTFNVNSLVVMNNTTNTPINWQYTAGTLSDYHFTMPDSDVTISGEFTVVTSPTRHMITVSTRPNGTVTLSPVSIGNMYDSGSLVTIIVNPDQGYQLQTLSVMSGSTTINHNPNTSGGYSFTMPASDVMVNAVFEEIINGTITVQQRDGGTITTSPSNAGNTFPAGTMITISVTLDPGFQLQSLMVMSTSGSNQQITPQPTTDGSGSFFFYMPNGDVMINPTFAPITGGTTGQ